MQLGEALEKAVGHVQSGVLSNEAEVKQWVIVPILRSLGWDDTDPGEFCPEYQVDSGKVDYAFIAKRDPLVFVEAKRLGKLDAKAEDQIFSYATNNGVPLLVLTDGNVWDFYLSMAAGKPGDRQFLRIELDGGVDLSEDVQSFQRFLAKERVATEKAFKEAERLLRDNKRRGVAREALPDAWRKLLSPPDELLVDLLAETAQSLCEVKPFQADVEHFLREVSEGSLSTSKPPRESKPKKGTITAPPQTKPRKGSAQSKILGYRLGGEVVECRSGATTLVAVLNALQTRDSGFLHRLYEDSRNRTRTRVFVSQRRSDLYSKEFFESENFSDNMCQKLVGGWWVGTNLSADTVRAKIIWACEVAGVAFGSELVLI